MAAVRLFVGIVLCLVVFGLGQYLAGINAPMTIALGFVLKILGGVGIGLAIAEYRGDILNNGY